MPNMNKLAGKMRENQITQKQLAQKLGISKTTVNYKMTGKRLFDVDEARRISILLNLSEQDRGEIFF